VNKAAGVIIIGIWLATLLLCVWLVFSLHRALIKTMRDRTLIMTGVAGAVLAAVCYATPLLAILFGAIGLTAWVTKADYVLIPALIVCVALIGFGLSVRKNAVTHDL
jgi:mercuric ion transport protein